MGEYADDVIDSMIDGHWGPQRRTSRLQRRYPTIKTCNRCGANDLRWQNVPGGKWRLHTRDGNLHICGSSLIERAQVEGDDDVQCEHQ